MSTIWLSPLLSPHTPMMIWKVWKPMRNGNQRNSLLLVSAETFRKNGQKSRNVLYSQIRCPNASFVYLAIASSGQQGSTRLESMNIHRLQHSSLCSPERHIITGRGIHIQRYRWCWFRSNQWFHLVVVGNPPVTHGHWVTNQAFPNFT